MKYILLQISMEQIKKIYLKLISSVHKKSMRFDAQLPLVQKRKENLNKLDGLGLVDNIHSTDYLHHFI